MERALNKLLPSHYEVLEVLGQGRHGLVCLVKDVRDGSLYAAKEFPGGRESAQLFYRELSLLFSLRHDHIVQCANLIYQGDSGGLLLLEYVSGGSLRQLLASHPEGLPLEMVERVAWHIASALAAAHSGQIIHCDIKPENILWQNGPDGHPIFKLSDLGIAVHLARGGGEASRGTPLYMAPEQFFDQPQPSSDVYALGVVLFECLTGQPPFEGDSQRLFLLHQQESPPWERLPDSKWRPLLEKMLAKSPSQRPASGVELAEELSCLLFGDAAQNAPSSARALSSSRCAEVSLARMGSLRHPPILSPGAKSLFALGDERWIYCADANSVDRVDGDTGVVKRAVWHGIYQCSAWARQTGDAILLISGRLRFRKGWEGQFRLAASDGFAAEAAAAHPQGNFFLLGCGKNLQAISPAGFPLWSAACPNYYLRPSLHCAQDGTVYASTGPANPGVMVYSSEGRLLGRISTPGPVLAMGGAGSGCWAVIQGSSPGDPALLVEFHDGKLKVCASLIPKVFAADWQGGFFTLLSAKGLLALVDVHTRAIGSVQIAGELLAAQRCGSTMAVLAKSEGPAFLSIYSLEYEPPTLAQAA